MEAPMNKIAVFTLCTVTLLALTGCANRKDANEGNFRSAIQKYLDTRNGVCVTLPDLFGGGRLKKGGSFTTDAPQAVAMVSAGLLLMDRSPAIVNFLGISLDRAPVYSLTPEGKKYLVGDPSFDSPDISVTFCGGKYRVTELQSFTAPATDGSGTTTSQVSYRYIVTGAPAWARQPELQAAYPSLQKDLNGDVSDTAVLVLTEHGWTDQRLLNRKVK